MSDWMRALGHHFEEMRRCYADDRLLLLLDVDGTILDLRYMIVSLLHRYDEAHDTGYFEGLRPEEIDVHEDQVTELLQTLRVPREARESVTEWYLKERWKPYAIREMHRPFEGVLNVVRWFQLQPCAEVALVTGRPEALREDTLRALNALGEPYRVTFADELLYMNPNGWHESVPDVKVQGLRHFRDEGYRVFAFVDNEPANLQALAGSEPDEELLLLHASTLFESSESVVPSRTVRGNHYRLSDLVPDERALPEEVELAWHGVNEPGNLRQFLRSPARWAEVDCRQEPGYRSIILRHDGFQKTPRRRGEQWLTLPEVLEVVKEHGQCVKIDFKQGGDLVEAVLAQLQRFGFGDDEVWFNANIERLGPEGFRRLCTAYPQAIIQCPADFLMPLIVTAPDEARRMLEMLAAWGVNRLSLDWRKPTLRQLFLQLDAWGYAVNIWGISDLDEFLEAILLLPASVTADFNFPRWHYYGRGSGEGGRYITYEQRSDERED